jgi:hypothetical protein
MRRMMFNASITSRVILGSRPFEALPKPLKQRSYVRQDRGYGIPNSENWLKARRLQTKRLARSRTKNLFGLDTVDNAVILVTARAQP